MSYDKLFSSNANNMRKSPIRELLRTADLNKLISFAGGYPNPSTFPIEELNEIMAKVIKTEGTSALQYSSTEGNIRLRNLLIERHRALGMQLDLDNIIITTSSQQAIDLITKITIDQGDKVICGLPSYLGALQSFYAYKADIQGVRDFSEMDYHLETLYSQNKVPKLIYTVPDFQNPTGETLTLEQRKNLVSLAQKYNIPIIEDSPYRDIRYEGEDVPMLYSLDPEHVVVFGTFSKTFAPGFRIGYVIGPKEIVRRMAIAKQCTDLCSPVFDQAVIAEYIARGSFDKNLVTTKELYRRKKDLILDLFEKYMPEYVTWTKPDGGIFLFVTLPEKCDASELFKITLEKNVAFVAGEMFHCDGSGKNTLRINYSFVSDEKTVEGVKILTDSIRKYVDSL